MPEGPDSVDGAERMVSDWNKRIQDAAQRYQAMAERVQELSVTERSAGGAIEVTINSKGILTNLAIAENTKPPSMSQLSGQIMSTVQRAQARIPQLLQEAMAETIGTEDETANRVFAEAKQHFPEPPAEDPPAPEPDRQLKFGPAADDAEPPLPNPPNPTPPPPPRPTREPPAPPPQPRRKRGPDDEDDDFGDQSIMR